MDELSGVVHMFGVGKVVYKSGNMVIRNRLNLPDRINVLRQYERTPDINHLARTFKCGRRQIKTILRKRKKYIAMWSRTHKQEPDFESPVQIAHGLILNEWINRARTYQINITDDILRNFALEIAEHIRFVDFKPTNIWLARFKQKYKLLNFERDIKQEPGIRPDGRKPLSITIIIDDLRQEYGDIVTFPNQPLPVNGDGSPIQGRKDIAVENLSSESLDSARLMENNLFGSSSDGDDATIEFAKEIETYKEALNQLGPLEQFVLMKENIRAVGLINQLENIFREEMNRSELGC